MSDADDEVSPSDRILMQALAEAIGSPRPPIDLAARCEGLLSWIDVDSELAMLLDQPLAEAAGTRGAAPAATTLVFTVDDGSCVIELDTSPTGLRGQLLGGETQEITFRTADGTAQRVPLDESGSFSIDEPLSGTVRLELELFPESRRIHTDWFVV